jgi:hypothetical protein
VWCGVLPASTIKPKTEYQTTSVSAEWRDSAAISRSLAPAIEMMFNTHDPSLWIDNDLILLVLLLPLYSTTLFVTLVARGRGRDGRTTSGRRIDMVIVGMGVVEFLVFQLVIFVVVVPARI